MIHSHGKPVWFWFDWLVSKGQRSARCYFWCEWKPQPQFGCELLVAIQTHYTHIHSLSFYLRLIAFNGQKFNVHVFVGFGRLIAVTVDYNNLILIHIHIVNDWSLETYSVAKMFKLTTFPSKNVIAYTMTTSAAQKAFSEEETNPHSIDYAVE